MPATATKGGLAVGDTSVGIGPLTEGLCPLACQSHDAKIPTYGDCGSAPPGDARARHAAAGSRAYSPRTRAAAAVAGDAHGHSGRHIEAMDHPRHCFRTDCRPVYAISGAIPWLRLYVVRLLGPVCGRESVRQGNPMVSGNCLPAHGSD